MKRNALACWPETERSPLTEGRGLKRRPLSRSPNFPDVAPHGGAWIETVNGHIAGYILYVAPHGGAWIET